MTKSDKELAIDVVKAVIEANSVKLAIAPNNVKHQTMPLGIKEINNVIESVYGTLQNLPAEK